MSPICLCFRFCFCFWPLPCRSPGRAAHLLRGAGTVPLFLMLLSLPQPLRAATDSDTFQVTASVLAACSITANDLNFGNYNPVSGTPLNAATTLEITCTNGAAYEVGLSAGLGAGASVATRFMTNGGNQLAYSLYSDAARTSGWGETSGVNTVSGTGSGALQALTVYGQIPGGQSVPAGLYTDTVTATITY